MDEQFDSGIAEGHRDNATPDDPNRPAPPKRVFKGNDASASIITNRMATSAGVVDAKSAIPSGSSIPGSMPKRPMASDSGQQEIKAGMPFKDFSRLVNELTPIMNLIAESKVPRAIRYLDGKSGAAGSALILAGGEAMWGSAGGAGPTDAAAHKYMVYQKLTATVDGDASDTYGYDWCRAHS